MKQIGTTSEEFIRLMKIIAEDKGLLQWFLLLDDLPENLRYSHIRGMAERMQSDMIDSDLVDAVKALASPEVYEAASKTVRDLTRK